jgi:hypothetical protein
LTEEVGTEDTGIPVGGIEAVLFFDEGMGGEVSLEF